jgi:ribosomal protein L34
MIPNEDLSQLEWVIKNIETPEVKGLLQKITCQISKTPIHDTPLQIGELKHTVSMENYHQLIKDKKSGLIAVVPQYTQQIKETDIRANKFLDDKISAIHTAIKNAIKGKQDQLLQEFLKRSAFDLSSLIRLDITETNPTMRYVTILEYSLEHQIPIQNLEIEIPDAEQRLISVKQMLAYNYTPSFTLNYIDEEGENAAKSALLFLCATDTGQQILSQYPDLIKAISPDTMNRIVQSGPAAGQSALLLMLATEIGRQILSQRSDLIKAISPDTMNSIVQSGPAAGHSALFLMLATKTGRQILSQHPDLIKAISPVTMNSIVQTGPHEGQSVLFCLCATETGQQILSQRPDLIKAISPDTMNSIIQSGPAAGHSALFLMLATKTGRQILSQRSDLIKAISTNAMNSIVQSGPVGHSALLLMLVAKIGQQILSQRPDLIKAISPDTINSIIQSGSVAGQSALFWLLSTEIGRQVLSQRSDLIKAISPVTMNSIVQTGAYAGESVLLRLCATKTGQQFLSQRSDLIKAISPVTMNSIVQSGPVAGHSALLWLLSIDTDQQILSQHPDLIKAISPVTMNSIVQSGRVAGHSALFLMLSTEIGRQVLSQRSDLIKAISPVTMNSIVQTGAYAGESVLLRLCATEIGQQILPQRPDLIKAISPVTMNSIAQTGPYAGQSAFSVLNETPEGRKILAALKTNESSKHPRSETDISGQTGTKRIKTEASEDQQVYSINIDVIRSVAMRLRTTTKGVSQAGRNCAKLLMDTLLSLKHYRNNREILEISTCPQPCTPRHAPVNVEGELTTALTQGNGHLYENADFAQPGIIVENQGGSMCESIEQVAEVPKPEVTLDQLPSLFTSDQSGRTRLLEISWWWDEEKTLGHVMGAITRKDEMLLFDPQKYTGDGTSPIFENYGEFTQYCSSRDIKKVHYMTLDTWTQSHNLETHQEQSAGIKLEAP